MTKGISALKAEGAKVHLAYDGRSPTQGGGTDLATQDLLHAGHIAQRIARNVEEWGLDGVDIFYTGGYGSDFQHKYTASI